MTESRSSPPSNATATTDTESALDQVDQLAKTVNDLKRELLRYGEPGVVGRDTQQLTTYFAELHQFEVNIAQAMGIQWSAIAGKT